ARGAGPAPAPGHRPPPRPWLSNPSPGWTPDLLPNRRSRGPPAAPPSRPPPPPPPPPHGARRVAPRPARAPPGSPHAPSLVFGVSLLAAVRGGLRLGLGGGLRLRLARFLARALVIGGVETRAFEHQPRSP